MDLTVNFLWKKIEEQAKKIVKAQRENGNNIVIYRDSEEIFKDNFIYYHSLIREKYMHRYYNEPIELDRHKMAAIIICSILKTNIIGIAQRTMILLEQNKDPRNAFRANEKLALDVSLSYMHEALKMDITKGRVLIDDPDMLDNYSFPKLLASSETTYEDVFCTELYFSKTYFELSPVCIANTLFLLEIHAYPSLRSVTPAHMSGASD